ncbi:hypothetical protein I316_02223 [Kwoniella heveanensis BCC8398]|uniref:Uncharacterized protein n=1 Tax=Kwoniella heveanensis BCC8398 TaxID=1296120 RepID=A0A1B9GZ87_9TREE|nr:hypothetical protein I316_02223 [Kwoniella heveanensis BCC8398]
MDNSPSAFSYGRSMADADHQMLDPSSVSLPESTPGSLSTTSSSPHDVMSGDSFTPQPTNSLGEAASSFWSGAKPNEQSTAVPSTPLWPFEAFNPSVATSTADGNTNSSNSSNFDSTHTTPASTTPGQSYPFSRPNMMFRNDPLAAGGPVQTPNTASTPWSQTATSTMEPPFMPPPPPNTASASMTSPHAMGHASMSYSGPFTGLSPMFAGFTTASPTIEGTFASASASASTAASSNNPQVMRPGGPIRTYSASATIPAGRKRSTTMMTLNNATAPSPASGTFNSYPYPSPRGSNPFMNPQTATINQIQTPTLVRPPSAPVVAETKRVFHPSPATSISPAMGVDLTHLPMEADSYAHRMGLSMGMGMRSTQPMESKPPRFKPTKEQLEILVKSYEENNRSKSRAKERDANLPKPLHTRGGSASHGHRSSVSTSGSKSSSKGIDIDALRNLIHDDDSNLTILPISVLSVANWTRFLMPGTGTSHPDLAAALRMPPSPNPANLQPHLYMYVVHKTDSFRIEIPLIPTCVSNLQAASNPSLNAEAVAIRFELSMGTAKYAAWDNPEGRWNEVGDFTGGETSGGGKCELTGDKEVLLSTFTKVQQLLAGQPYPTPPLIDPAMSFPPPSSSSGSSWRFPSISASTSFSSTAPIRTPSLDLGHGIPHPTQHNRADSIHRQRQRSLSQTDIGSSSSGNSDSKMDRDTFSSMSSSSGKTFNFGQSATATATDRAVDAAGTGQVPLPLSTLHGSEAGRTELSDYGMSLSWAQLGSPGMAIPPEVETPGAGFSATDWGFPITSSSGNRVDHASGPLALQTPITSSMNMGVSGENCNHAFSTLTSLPNPVPVAQSYEVKKHNQHDHGRPSGQVDSGTSPLLLDTNARGDRDHDIGERDSVMDLDLNERNYGLARKGQESTSLGLESMFDPTRTAEL